MREYVEVEERRKPTVSLAWCGMVCHAQNWAPISPTLPILPILSTLQPPFCCSSLLCSALLCPALPCPVLPVHTGLLVALLSGLSGYLSAVPAPIPKLNFCIAHAILSDPVGKTKPNTTQPSTHTYLTYLT